MPRHVEREERLSQIAAAALAVARLDGLSAVTFRRVAAEMGAASTTVVTHYVENRAALVQLMLAHLFGLAESLVDPVLAAMTPEEGLALIAEAILPISDESRLLASIALDAAREFGTDAEVGDELESWGGWLQGRVVSLVEQIAPGDDSGERADALLAALAGFTLYGLVDRQNWPPERQRAALKQLLASLHLDRSNR